MAVWGQVWASLEIDADVLRAYLPLCRALGPFLLVEFNTPHTVCEGVVAARVSAGGTWSHCCKGPTECHCYQWPPGPQASTT